MHFSVPPEIGTNITLVPKSRRLGSDSMKQFFIFIQETSNHLPFSYIVHKTRHFLEKTFTHLISRLQ